MEGSFTLLDIIKEASKYSNKGITFINGDDNELFISYNELYLRAQRILFNLQLRGMECGQELLIQIEDSFEFLSVFWACIIGGIIPVPVSIGNGTDRWFKVFNIWKKLKNPFIIIDSKTYDLFNKYICEQESLIIPADLKENLIKLDEIVHGKQIGVSINPKDEDIAFVQFSSGSTGNPNGVILSHKNLISNIKAIIKGSEITEKDKVLSWMPLTHDMGLIGFHLVPVATQINQCIIPTALFIKRPSLWLKKVDEHRATILSSPNFGYKYFVDNFKEKTAEHWDLSSVRLIFNGAEPINWELCSAFLDRMSSYGLKRSSMFPVYGLAEASLAVTFPIVDSGMERVLLDRKNISIGNKVNEIEDEKKAVSFVYLGSTVDYCSLRICNDNDIVQREDTIGHIQIKGNNVTNGYYGDVKKTEDAITSDGWLRTGDLGFLRKGNLVVTGRAKDIIFVNGQNFYPHDIEDAASDAGEPGHGKIAVGSILNAHTGRENIIVFVLHKKSLESFVPLVTLIKESIFKRTGLWVDMIIPVTKIPKTTSGKIQRFVLCKNYLNGEYNSIIEELKLLIDHDMDKPSNYSPKTDIEKTLTEIVNEVFEVEDISASGNLVELGGNSLLLGRIHDKIEKKYPGIISVADIFKYPSIAKLAKYIEAKQPGDYPNLDGENMYYTENRKNPEHTVNDDLSDKSIAIIGMCGKYPNSNSLNEFWENIKQGINLTRDFPAERRKDIDRYLEFLGEDINSFIYSKGAYLEDIDKFDYKFFGISKQEADLMNPLQRLVLEVAWNAIEDAGYMGEDIIGSNTGIYFGFISDLEGYKYKEMIHDIAPHLLPISAVGNLTSVIPGRISHLLDLKGPSILIDTACSSSLVAIDMACDALRLGRCDMAIAGGIKINLVPIDRDCYKIGVESSDYLTKAFDEDADGSGIGEGVGVVLLKPLKRALVDRDNIYAVIKGSAVNQDGNSAKLTAPNPTSQTDVIVKAWNYSCINPETISYIEAHGTGTKIGDPIEFEALKNAFENYTDKKQFCAIGSVKSNLGHLHDCAGITSIIKAVLALKNKQLPPSILFNNPNKKISFENSPLYFNSRLRKLKTNSFPVRCGISSFGISGVNCHLVLEEAPYSENETNNSNSKRPYVLTLSAKTEVALKRLITDIDEYLKLEERKNLRDICYTSNIGRKHYNYRLAIVTTDLKDLKNKIGYLCLNGLINNTDLGVFYGKSDFLHEESIDEIYGLLSTCDGLTDPNMNIIIKLCSFYKDGYTINWKMLYKGECIRRVSIPVYPFERERCWIDIPGKKRIKSFSDSDIFYGLNWKEEGLVSKAAAYNHKVVITLRTEEYSGEITDRLVENLKQQGVFVVECVLGDSYKKISENNYIVPNNESGFGTLFNEDAIIKVSQIIHISLLSDGIKNLEDLKHSQVKGVYSLLNMIKALAKAKIGRKIDLVLLTNSIFEVSGYETAIYPEKATLTGLGKVINAEFPSVACRGIDIDESLDIEYILDELNNIESKSYQTAFRNSRKYIEEFGEVNINSVADRDVGIKKDGVYLITGGTGDIGLELAEYLASKEKVSLILVGRTKLPFREKWNEVLKCETDGDKRIHKIVKHIMKIESKGSCVQCFSADVSVMGEMQEIVRCIKERYGKVNGVIHTAGIGDAELLLDRSLEDFANVIAPKVFGTYILDSLTREDDLDFFIMISSAATLFGTPCEGDYTAANLFLEAYTAYRNKNCRNTITISWPAWKEKGMAYEHGFYIDALFKAILTSDAVNGFERVLSKNITRVFVGEINYDKNIMYRLEKFPGQVSENIIIKAENHGFSRFLGKNIKDVDDTYDEEEDVKLTGGIDGKYTLTEKKLGGLYKKILRLNNIDINENFFELGGDSFKGASLVSLIKKEFGTNITIREMLSYGTLKSMAQCISEKEKVSYCTISQSEKRDKYELSAAQKRMFILKELEGDGIAYNNPEVFIIEGKVDRYKVEEAFAEIIKRHESLRTSFQIIDGIPYQVIHENYEFKLMYRECNDMGECGKNHEHNVIEQIVGDFIKPFNLDQLPLIRLGLIKLENEKYVLIFDTHHIITDGVSMSVIFREFVHFYSNRSLPGLKLQYKDFSEWQNKLLDSEAIKQQEKYWLDKFSGELPQLNMHTDFPRPLTQSFEGASIKFEIGEELSNSINKFSANNGVTPYIILLAAYNILLSKYTGQDDIVVGSPAAGRPFTEMMDIVGMFVNTLAMRNKPCKSKTVKEFIEEVRENSLSAFENQEFQFEELIERLNIKRDVARNPLFDTMFVLENIDYQDIEIENLRFKRYDASFSISKVDFILFVFENKLGYYLMLEYNTKLFKPETKQRLLTHYINIMKEIITSPHKRLKDIEMLSEHEIKRLLFEFNNTYVNYDVSRPIHRYFEVQAAKTPDNIAVEFENKTMTYRELNMRANQLARFLIKRGVTSGTVIAVMNERSFDMVISLIAVLKAGGAYLPIDRNMPDERINYMLKDSGAKLVLTNSSAMEGKQFTSIQGFEANNFDIVITSPREHIKEFDSLPVPDRSLIDIGRYKNKIGMASVNNCISLQTTRGCPYKCLYCHKIWSKNHVHRSAENIYSEIEYYYKNGVTNFAVIDDCFNLDIENSSRLFKIIIKNKLKIQIFFPNGLRGDILIPQYIDLMVEAGTRGVNLSLETASPRLQKMLLKNLNLEKFKEVVNYIATRHPGVILEMATMHGFPTETEEEAMMTINFIKDIKWLHFPYIHILKIFPNTEMEEFALENGVSKADILKSKDRAFHELPETLPFPKSFTRKYQSEFLNEYFLSKERLKQVLPVQMKIFDKNALAQKYNAYLPVEIKSIEDVIKFAEIEDIKIPEVFGKEEAEKVTIFSREFAKRETLISAKKILFLDLSQYFSSRSMLYKVCEQPLGHIYLLTFLKKKFGDKIDGRIYKSGVDFDSFEELRLLVEEYKPDLIGIRTLTFFKEFFHNTVSLLKQWLGDVPVITGGPYASSDYDSILKDKNVSLVIFGEGEYTFVELVEKMLDNNFKIPNAEILGNIKGIAYTNENLNEFKDFSHEIISVDVLRKSIEKENTDNLCNNLSSEELSYVLYTSGTTGRPKGIMVEHRQINNCILWMEDEFKLNPSDVVVQRTNLTFDPSVWEIFWPLYKGASIRLLTEEQGKDANFLIELMSEDHNLTVMYCPASLVSAMTYITENMGVKPKLKLPWLIIGAEPISRKVINTFYKYFDGKIVNTYGPTESTINNTYYHVEREEQYPVVPIGKPVSNNCIYIVSKDMELLPTNIPGEICISGNSVARGYINNEDKTKEHFFVNPFGEGRLYKTGDIGKWNEDGNIEIYGRVDHQVKIRGYRIELEEIKNSITTSLPVKDCVVVVKDSTNSQGKIRVCKKCGIGTMYPGVVVNDEDVCEICENKELYNKYANKYFGDLNNLERIIRDANIHKDSKYDCLILFSGGRGAGYALYKLVDMGLKVLAATYDNGYFSRSDIENIKSITSKLNVDHVVLKHKNTGEILKESIKKFHTVCRGCFQVSSALAMEYAMENKIGVVVGATLSRGQIAENKLFMFYKQGISNVNEIEKELLDIHKNSPNIDKEIYKLIDINVVNDGAVYDKVKVVDFYRYCNITNDEMISYTNERDPYWRTRRTSAIYSTNCPIKQIGDYSHMMDKSYHYYGSATHWEKRFGHIILENIKEELHIKVTQDGYENFLKRIGYEKKSNSTMEEKFLCAYYVSEKSYTVAEFRETLQGKLPDYMVPSHFIKLDSIPLTLNGKVDFNSLPDIQKTLRVESNIKPPSSNLEMALVEIWKEVLEVEHLGVTDNFFELGGHSLKATILASKIHKELNVKVPLGDIFKNATVKELAECIEGLQTDLFYTIEHVETKENGIYPLSSSQNSIYLSEQLTDVKVAFNMASVVLLEGNVEREKLEGVFKTLIERHETLRTLVAFVDGQLVQKIHSNVVFNLEYTNIQDSDKASDILDKLQNSSFSSFKQIEGSCQYMSEIVREFVKPFDLSSAPLFRAKLVQLSASMHFLLFDIHHIISDGISMSIILNDVLSIYAGNNLPELRVQYKDYCAWKQKMSMTDIYKKQEEYWINKFSVKNGPLPVLNLSADYPRPSVKSFKGSTIKFEADTEITARLKAIASEMGATLYMVLLAGFNILLHKYTGQMDIVLGTPVSGRSHEDLYNTVGIFVNMLPVRNYIQLEKSFSEFLSTVKTNLMDVYQNQDYPFEAVLNMLNLRTEKGHNPLYDVVFAMQNMDLKPTAKSGIKLTPYDVDNGVSRYDIAIQVIESEDKVHFIMEYCTQLYKSKRAEKIAKDFLDVLKQISVCPYGRIGEISLESEREVLKAYMPIEDITFNF